MEARKLNELGLRKFNDYILECREGKPSSPPFHLLEADQYSSELNQSIGIENRHFDNRYQIGQYLVEVLKPVEKQSVIGDIGFWSWLALYWFEQLCSKDGGAYKPSKEYNYILSKDFKHRPRHSLFMTWQLVNEHGENAHFILSKEPHTRGELAEQMLSRQEILYSNGIIKLASNLYFDPNTESFKRGAAARKSKGCVTRFIMWLQQIALTYDVFSMSDEQLSSLLPVEFDRFRKS